MADDNFTRSNMLEGAGNRVQITHAVINHGNALGHGSENPFCRRAGACYRRVTGDSHSQRPTKCLEDRFGLMMRIVATEVIDVQGHITVIHKALKKFNEKIEEAFQYFCESSYLTELEVRTNPF